MRSTENEKALHRFISSGFPLKELLEWEKKHPSRPLRYLPECKFRRISMNNFASYRVIGTDENFVHTLTQSGILGFVFGLTDVQREPVSGLVPAVTISLRHSGDTNRMQATQVNIQNGFAKRGIPSRWYKFYRNTVGDLAPDFNLLDGDKVVHWADLPSMGE